MPGLVAEAHLEARRIPTAREFVARVREQATHPYCGAGAMAIERQLQLFSARIAVTHERLRQAARGEAGVRPRDS